MIFTRLCFPDNMPVCDRYLLPRNGALAQACCCCAQGMTALRPSETFPVGEFRASPVSIMATSSTRCESPGVDPWTCMPKHTNPQRDMLEHPIFALPHNRIHPYSDHALTALGRTPTLEAGRNSAGRPRLGPMRQIAVEAESDRRANTDRSGRNCQRVRSTPRC